MSTPTSLDLPDEVRRTTIRTRRGPFAALEAGPASGVCEREAALLVPGYTGSKEDFLAVLGQLAGRGRRVFAIDMRGQFETPGAPDHDGYSASALGSDITALLRATGAKHLLGHSYGGLIAREAVLASAGGELGLGDPDEHRPGGADRAAGGGAAEHAGGPGRRRTTCLRRPRCRPGSPTSGRRTWNRRPSRPASRARSWRSWPSGCSATTRTAWCSWPAPAHRRGPDGRAGAAARPGDPGHLRRGRQLLVTGRAGGDGRAAGGPAGVHPRCRALPRRGGSRHDRGRADASSGTRPRT